MTKLSILTITFVVSFIAFTIGGAYVIEKWLESKNVKSIWGFIVSVYTVFASLAMAFVAILVLSRTLIRL